MRTAKMLAVVAESEVRYQASYETGNVID